MGEVIEGMMWRLVWSSITSIVRGLTHPFSSPWRTGSDIPIIWLCPGIGVALFINYYFSATWFSHYCTLFAGEVTLHRGFVILLDPQAITEQRTRLVAVCVVYFGWYKRHIIPGHFPILDGALHVPERSTISSLMFWYSTNSVGNYLSTTSCEVQ